MRKIPKFLPLLLVCVLLFSGCTLLNHLTNSMDHLPVKEYLDAVSAGDEGFLNYIYPSKRSEAKETAEKLEWGKEFLAGRTVSDVNCTSVDVHSDLMKNEKTTESSYVITLSDGTELQAQVVYLSDSSGEGFTQFRLSE